MGHDIKYVRTRNLLPFEYTALMQSTYIYGRHAVKILIETQPQRVQGVFASIGAEREFTELARRAHIRVEPLAEHDFRKELDGAVHQGVVAKVAMDGLVQEYDQFIEHLLTRNARPENNLAANSDMDLDDNKTRKGARLIRGLEITPSTSLVILNEITDPHNVGAIIRSAAAFGVAGVLIPTHNQAPITGAVAKASAGMVFAMPIVAINNENQTIEDLKKRRFWIYGLAGEGKNEIYKEKFDAPAVFVVGSEGEGLRAKTREHCDILLRIPMHPRTESLNASVSAAVVLAEWSKQHPEALLL